MIDLLQYQDFQNTTKVVLPNDRVILLPLTMRIPNSQNIYFPSELKSKKEIGYEEFLQRYSDHPVRIRVCFDETLDTGILVKSAIVVTAFNLGLDGWYIIEAYNSQATQL